MKIRKVTIRNINSLRLDTTIDFEADPLQKSGLFAITGDTGAGKTTILDAITLALYGRVHRNKDVAEVMSYGTTDCLAEVEFDNGTDRYLAKWSMWRARNRIEGNIQPDKREVSKWNPAKEAYEIIAEKKREADQVVEEVTGLDYERFTRSVLLAQGDFAAFLQADERHRSDLLERITGTEIYTRLSQSAFERFKLELQKLEELQRRRSQLDILSPEQLSELRRLLDEKQRLTEIVREELKTRRADLQWVLEKTALEKKEIGQQQKLETIGEEKRAAAPELKKLENFNRVRPFESRIHRLDDLLDAAAETEIQSRKLQEEAETHRAATKTASEVFDEKERLLAGARKQRTEKQLIFESVIRMDAAIGEKKAPLEKKRRELHSNRESLTRNRSEVELLGRKRVELEKAFAEIGLWLKNNERLAGLQNDLSGMEQLAGRWLDKKEQAENTKTLRREREKERTASKQKTEALAQKGKILTERISQLESDFRTAAPREYVTGRTELLERMAGELDELNARREGLQQLVRLSAEYQQLLRRQDEHEEEIAGLLSQELALYKELMTAIEMLAGLDEDISYRQKVYQQQQMIANYEKDRRQLPEGEPCPLCFSTDHPFRNQEIKPFVDEAWRDLEKATGKRDKTYRWYLDLQKQQNEVVVKLEQLTGNEREALKGRRRDLQEQIEQYERQITGMQSLLGRELLSIGQVSFLNDKLSEAENLIASGRQKRKTLQQLHHLLETEETALVKLREQQADRQTNLQILDNEISHLDNQFAAHDNEAKTALEALLRLIEKYEPQPDEKKVIALLDALKERKNEYAARQETFRRLEREIELTAQQESQQKEELLRLERTDVSLASEVKDAEAELEVLVKERLALFGDRSPREEREALEKDIREKEAELEQSRLELEEAKLRLRNTEALIRQRKEDVKLAEQRAGKLEKELHKAIKKAGLSGLETARSFLLDEKAFQDLERLQKELEQRELECRKSLEEVRKDLESIRKDPKTEAGEPELNEEIATLEHRLGEFLQESGGIRQQLHSNEEREKEAVSLIGEIEKQKLEYERWARLNEIIGAGDGKKFRIFAQGLTLNRLVRLANEHLRNLNGRYVIRKRSDEDLALDIIDTFQADNRRSMNTLSGGESFLVSLALALGLSDLAGQQANIRSLFIDEGFGTLDADSLDLAISTLENLQAGGKVIGIISHVRELKERIAVQISINKKGNGFSDIEIVG